MFVGQVKVLYSGTNITITHSNSVLYTGTTANLPFYYLNERVVSINAVNSTTISLEI